MSSSQQYDALGARKSVLIRERDLLHANMRTRWCEVSGMEVFSPTKKQKEQLRELNEKIIALETAQNALLSNVGRW